MARFLVDENLPRSLVRVLREAGMHADDVREVGLRGEPDARVFTYARRHAATLLTGDRGFGNLIRFPVGTHSGIVVVRFPNETPVDALNDAVLVALRGLADDDVVGSLVIIEPGRIRLRRGA